MIDSIRGALPTHSEQQIRTWVQQQLSVSKLPATPVSLEPDENVAITIYMLHQQSHSDFEHERSDDAIVSEQQGRERLSLLRTRVIQMRQNAQSMNVHIQRIPNDSEGWSPLLVPEEQRIELLVSSELLDADMDRLKRELWDRAGIKCELTPRMTKDLSRLPSITLRVTDMTVDMWLNWICKLGDWKYEFKNGTVVLDQP